MLSKCARWAWRACCSTGIAHKPISTAKSSHGGIWVWGGCEWGQLAPCSQTDRSGCSSEPASLQPTGVARWHSVAHSWKGRAVWGQHRCSAPGPACGGAGDVHRGALSAQQARCVACTSRCRQHKCSIAINAGSPDKQACKNTQCSWRVPMWHGSLLPLLCYCVALTGAGSVTAPAAGCTT